jgi:2-amino-4-hydroxy-6-hydroxymethyldihydropteridine diphosphokinase
MGILKEKKSVQEVYVGLGANLGDPYSQLHQALEKIEEHPSISCLQTSRFYLTTPVSSRPQPLFVNAVCRFQTSLVLSELWIFLSAIQLALGQKPKPKEDPRRIDLDILFFGKHPIFHEELQIPHPRWRERLFVLQPLSDLTHEIELPVPPYWVNVHEELKTFSNPHQEQIRPVCR